MLRTLVTSILLISACGTKQPPAAPAANTATAPASADGAAAAEPTATAPTAACKDIALGDKPVTCTPAVEKK